MCGKFTQMYEWDEVHGFSQALAIRLEAEHLTTTTPMRLAKVLLRSEQGIRSQIPMRWGFSKKSATTPSRPDHMHARAETIDTRPTFKDAFARHRGIVLVNTFNEGEELPSGKTKQWVITPKDKKPIAIAAICEQWTNGAETLWTFVMVTVPPNDLIARITDRMPAVLTEDTWNTWLGEGDPSLEEVKALLQTYDDEGNWEMAPQAPSKPPKPPPHPQSDLF